MYRAEGGTSTKMFAGFEGERAHKEAIEGISSNKLEWEGRAQRAELPVVASCWHLRGKV